MTLASVASGVTKRRPSRKMISRCSAKKVEKKPQAMLNLSQLNLKKTSQTMKRVAEQQDESEQHAAYLAQPAFRRRAAGLDRRGRHAICRVGVACLRGSSLRRAMSSSIALRLVRREIAGCRRCRWA